MSPAGGASTRTIAAYPEGDALRQRDPVGGPTRCGGWCFPDGSVPGPITIGGAYMGAPEIETDNIPHTGDERPVLKDDGAGSVGACGGAGEMRAVDRAG